MYEIESYDMYDAPSERTHMQHGAYESATAALAAARAIVEASLLALGRPDMTAASLAEQFNHFGEVPMIFGKPEVPFAPFAYATEIAPVILIELRNRAAH